MTGAVEVVIDGEADSKGAERFCSFSRFYNFAPKTVACIAKSPAVYSEQILTAAV